MRKSRTAADPRVNLFIMEIARYTDNRSQLNDLFHNTYILIQRSCFSTYHIKNHAGTQWSALSLTRQASPLLCFTTRVLWILFFPPWACSHFQNQPRITLPTTRLRIRAEQQTRCRGEKKKKAEQTTQTCKMFSREWILCQKHSKEMA